MPIVNTIDLSSSMSIFADTRDVTDTHFKWSNIKKFIYLSCIYSMSTYNFDIFSRICWNVKIFHFLLCEMVIGMPYMFMDCFIKQYTRKLNSNKHLNPLLRGITYGLFLQTGLWTIIHATYLADSMRYFISSLQDEPSWSTCYKTNANSTCVAAKEVMLRCHKNTITKFTITSAHYYYVKTFTNFDRTVLTSKLFAVGLVWMLNFIFSTLHVVTLIKNLAAVFNSTSKYGPSDPVDRKQRQDYNETMRHRQCKHNCNMLDEIFDCNHLAAKAHVNCSLSTLNSSPSLSDIFEAGTVVKTPSGLIESESHD